MVKEYYHNLQIINNSYSKVFSSIAYPPVSCGLHISVEVLNGQKCEHLPLGKM